MHVEPCILNVYKPFEMGPISNLSFCPVANVYLKCNVFENEYEDPVVRGDVKSIAQLLCNAATKNIKARHRHRLPPGHFGVFGKIFIWTLDVVLFATYYVTQGPCSCWRFINLKRKWRDSMFMDQMEPEMWRTLGFGLWLCALYRVAVRSCCSFISLLFFVVYPLCRASITRCYCHIIELCSTFSMDEVYLSVRVHAKPFRFDKMLIGGEVHGNPCGFLLSYSRIS